MSDNYDYNDHLDNDNINNDQYNYDNDNAWSDWKDNY